MPTNAVQWFFFTFFVVGSLGGWMALFALYVMIKRADAREVSKVVIE